MNAQCLLATLVAVALLMPAPVEAKGRKSLRALPVDVGSIVVDGRLDEPHWPRAETAGDFILLEPTPGEPATQQTVAHVLYDEEAIYVGFHCYEDRPEKIQASSTRYDSEVYLDDAVEVFLDTYQDRRSCYYFMANTIGTRLDGRVNDEGRVVDATWDANWTVAVSFVKGGWQMEMGIPIDELSFRPAEEQSWGINFWRTERPHWEQSYWSPTGENIFRVSSFGDLVGLRGLRRRRQLKAIPSLVGRLERRSWEDVSELTGDVGLDLQYALTSNLTANVTVYPDFAQIEADQDRFNLSYQEGEEIFYPEKRPFFLEGIDILQTPLNLFYTRRIVDILYGAKIIGKVGRVNVAALNVGTEETTRERGNFSAIRCQGDIFSSATLGVLITDKEESGGGFSRAVGLDVHLPVRNPLDLNLQVARCHNPGVVGGEWAATFNVGGEGETYELNLDIQAMGDRFVVDQGYIPAYSVGRREGSLFVGRRFLRDRWWFRWLKVSGSYDQQENSEGEVTRRAGEVYGEVVTTNKLRPFWGIEMSHERYVEGFDNVIRYVGIETNVGGWNGVFSTYQWGDRYGERWDYLRCGICFNVLGRASFFINNEFRRSGQIPWDWIGWAKINVQPRSDIFWRGFFQRNSRNHTFLFNTLVGHEFSPGTILYVGYNQTWHTSGDDRVEHVALAKLVYLLTF